MKKNIFLILIYLFINSICYANDFKSGKDPEGFRGINWQDDINQHQELKFLKKDNLCNKIIGCPFNLDVYINADEILKLGMADIERVEYSFHDSKLFSVSVYVDGYDNYMKLKNYAFENYGEINNMNYEHLYWWYGDEAQMALQALPQAYNVPEGGVLTLYSQNVIKFIY